jgi:hypothetical protein
LQIKKALETDIENALNKINPDANSMLKEAKRVYAEGKQTFSSPLFKSLAQKNPEKIVDGLLKYDNAVDLKRVKDVIGEDAFSNVRRRAVQDMAEAAFGTEAQKGTSEQFFKHGAINKMLSSYSPETMDVLFGKEGVKELRNIVKISNAMQTAEKLAGNPSGTAQNMIWYSQLFNLVARPATGVASMGVPYMYSKMITSPVGRKFILDGMKVTPGTKEAAKFATRFIEYATAESLRDRSQDRKLERK